MIFVYAVLEKWIFDVRGPFYDDILSWEDLYLPDIEFVDVSKLFGLKMFTRKLLKLKWTHVSVPTARVLICYFFELIFRRTRVRLLFHAFCSLFWKSCFSVVFWQGLRQIRKMENLKWQSESEVISCGKLKMLPLGPLVRLIAHYAN